MSIEMVNVDPNDLAAAHQRDQAALATATSTLKPREPGEKKPRLKLDELTDIV